MRKKNAKRLVLGTCVSAALLFGVSGMRIQAEADSAVIQESAEPAVYSSSVIASGNCGEKGQDVTWTLNKEGVLRIKGKGAIQGEGYNSYMPWRKYVRQIKKIVIEEGITKIGGSSFANCSEVTEIKIPDSVEEIGWYAFYYCSSLESIDLGKGVTIIWGNAFCYTGIKNITLPKQLTKLKEYALEEMNNLDNIYVESGNPVFTSKDGVLYSDGGKTLFRCPKKREGSFEIPKGVTKLNSHAFAGCGELTEITMPSTLKEIGDRTFEGCSGLTALEFPEKIREIPAWICLGCPNLTEVTFPENLKKIGERAFLRCWNLEKITIPSTVVEMGAEAFEETTTIDWKRKSTVLEQEDGSYKEVAVATVKVKEEYKKAFEVLELINKERKKAGCDPLVMDQSLLKTAMERSAETVLYYSHTRPNGLDCDSLNEALYGENIAMGAPTAEDVMSVWMNSAMHRMNILAKSYQSVGIGCVKCNGEYFWVQCFGKKKGTSVTASAYKDGTKKKRILVSKEKEYFKPTIKVSKTSMKEGEEQTIKYTWNNDYFDVTLDASTLKAQTSDSSVVKVSNGKIVAVGAGTAKVSLYVEGCPDQKKVLEFEVEDNGSSTGNTAKKVKVSWNANGGKVSGSSKVVKYKGTYGKLPSPKRAGYTFAGWYTSRTGGSKVAANTKVTKKKNHTLYARWKKTAVGNAAIGKLTNVSGKKLKVQIKSIKGAKKYQVYLAEDAKFSKGKKIVTFGKSTGTITKLKKGTTYYVKVRGYCNDSAGKRVYGKFSAVKKIEIKK